MNKEIIEECLSHMHDYARKLSKKHNITLFETFIYIVKTGAIIGDAYSDKTCLPDVPEFLREKK